METCPSCPPSTFVTNKKVCNQESICFMGECTGSICIAYGLESCQCKRKFDEPDTKLCELCCRFPGDDATCKSSFEWNTAPLDLPHISTLEIEHGTRRLKVLTYDSAQYLYQSKRRGLLSGPEEEERVADEWYTIDVDLAFKCNWLKFRQNEHFADESMRTDRKFLVYSETRGNKDWSDITAKILMIICEDLRRQAERKD
uniref:Uncharacterized protein n=1 Tax=Tetranychus urticae TaxID=32264 RepID=T1L1V5_TETUR